MNFHENHAGLAGKGMKMSRASRKVQDLHYIGSNNYAQKVGQAKCRFNVAFMETVLRPGLS